MGVRGKTTLLSQFAAAGKGELYVDKPVEADDPYRSYGW
jgi:hypothetical protein